MLPILITDPTELKRCQARLESELRSHGESFAATYATRGQRKIEHDAVYFREFNFYWKSGDYSKENRYWNTFGIGRPENLRDAFHAAIPKKGVDRHVRGGFLKCDGETFLLHRGPLGGGRKDGPHDTRDIVPDLVREYDDGGRVATGVVIPFITADGNFDDDFLPRVASMVKAVARELDRQ